MSHHQELGSHSRRPPIPLALLSLVLTVPGCRLGHENFSDPFCGDAAIERCGTPGVIEVCTQSIRCTEDGELVSYVEPTCTSGPNPVTDCGAFGGARVCIFNPDTFCQEFWPRGREPLDLGQP